MSLSDPWDDRELRARFGRMREDDQLAAVAPDFDRMIAGGRPEDLTPGGHTRGLVRVAGWVTVAAAAAVAGVLMTGRSDSDAEFDRLVVGYSSEVGPGIWDSPTAGLLAVPGSELLRGMPALGASALPDLSFDLEEVGL